MKQPDIHAKLHPAKRDAWNPYKERDYAGHLMDDAVFALIVQREEGSQQDSDLFWHGCLDAPEMIPLGATTCTKTIGGWDREYYLRAPRDCESWATWKRAQEETAEMLAKILEGRDD